MYPRRPDMSAGLAFDNAPRAGRQLISARRSASTHLRTRRRLSRTLNTNRHQHIHLALHRLVRFYPRVHQCDQLIEDSLLVRRQVMFPWSWPTFCTMFFLFDSLPPAFSASSSSFFTFVLTLFRNEPTSLTLTSDSSRAAQSSLRRASTTCRSAAYSTYPPLRCSSCVDGAK